MEIKLGRLQQFVMPSALVLTFALSVFGPLIFPDSAQKTSTWRGYYTLVAGDQITDRLVTDSLLRVGMKGVISATTATVSFNDFSSMQNVPVADLDKRFDPVDPRLDPYMKRVASLFETRVDGRPMQIVYIPKSGIGSHLPGLGILRVNALAHRALDQFNVSWYVLEWNSLRRYLFLFSFLVFVALLLLRTHRSRLFVALGVLPWTISVLVSGYGGFAASCVLVFAWAYLLEEGVPALEKALEQARVVQGERESAYGSGRGRWLTRELIIRIVFYIAALVVAAVLDYDGTRGFASLLQLVPGVVGTAALFGLMALYVRSKLVHREHALFIPLRILHPSVTRALRGTYTSVVPVLLFVLILPPLVLLVLPRDSQVYVPRPVPVSGIRTFAWASVEKLWHDYKADSLPDLSDYIAHRAYQDAFMYHLPYEFPRPGQAVTIPTYNWKGLSVTEHAEVMYTFDQAWYTRQMDHAGVPALFLAQGRPVRIERQPAGPLYADYSVLLRHTGIVLIVFLPFLISLIQISMRIRFGFRDTIVRKRRIEA